MFCLLLSNCNAIVISTNNYCFHITNRTTMKILCVYLGQSNHREKVISNEVEIYKSYVAVLYFLFQIRELMGENLGTAIFEICNLLVKKS